jgi:hypothetical protein
VTGCGGGKNGKQFFGSSIECGSWIELRVMEAERNHDLGRDWISGNRVLLEVAMTPSQFAELLTTMNVGVGVPGTLHYIKGEEIPEIPKEHPEVQRIACAFEERMHEKAVGYKKILDELKADTDGKKSLGKGERDRLFGILGNLVQEFESNIPFYLEQFQKSMAKMVVEAKSEVDAFVTHAVQTTGLQAIRDQVKLEHKP